MQKNRLTIKNIKQIVVHTYREWSKDGTLRHGAAIAYYGVIAIFPYIIIMLVLALLLYKPDQIINSSANLIENIFSDRIVDTDAMRNFDYSAFVDFRSNLRNFGLIGLGSFLITASLFMNALQDSLNYFWKSDKRRKFTIRRYVLSSVAMLAAALTFTLVLIAQSFIKLIENLVPENSLVVSMGLNAISLLAFLVLLTILFMIIARALIKVNIDKKSLIISGFVTAILMYFGVYGISIYIGRFANFGYYGALSGFFLLLVALYYFAQIYLVGVQLGKVIAYRRGNKHLKEYLNKTDPRLVKNY